MASSRKKPKARRQSTRPDRVAEVPFGIMAQWGRFITMENTLTTAEHEAVAEEMIGQIPSLKDQQVVLRDRLIEILDATDPINLLARASLTYLHVDPDSFKEWESDRSPAHIEYLALQVLGNRSNGGEQADGMEAMSLTTEAVAIVRELFDIRMNILVRESARDRRQEPGNQTIDYVLKTRLQSLGIRGSGYPEHLERVLHGCFDPLENACLGLLGFTARDALKLTTAITDLMSDRITPLWQEASAGREQMLKRLKRARRASKEDPSLPDWLIKGSPTKAKAYISMLSTAWLFEDSRSFAIMTPEELASRSSIDVERCRAFLEAFTCPPGSFDVRHHRYPGGAHPLTERPILKIDDGYLLAVPSSMVEAIRPRIEDLIRADERVWDRYVDVRATYLEREATALLAAAFPGSKSWTNIEWASQHDRSDLDGLVVADDLGIRLQAKAGRLTAPARRGSTVRMERDIGNLIKEAADQHQALAEALKTGGATTLGFSSEQATALAVPLQVEAIVCLDDVTVWATETHELRRYGALPEDRTVPWVLSLTDLMAIVDLLSGTELAHYIVRRQRIERDGRISAHDELDWVGHYLAEGLFFDRYFRADQAHVFRLLSYTEPIDAWYFTRAGLRTTPAPKPSQGIPEHLHGLIGRLERERPQHWIVAALALLDGDQHSRETWELAIANSRQSLARQGWSNASQAFAGRLGVTLFIDNTIPWPEVQRRVAGYCQKKLDETGLPNWVGIGQGETGPMFVIVEQRDPNLSLVEVFLQPQSLERSTSGLTLDRR